MALVIAFYEFLWLYLGVVTAVATLFLVRSMQAGATYGLPARERWLTIVGLLVIGGGGAALLTWYRFGLGLPNPMCPTGGPTDTVIEVLGYVVTAGLLGWLWLGTGAQALSRVAPVLVGHAYTARQVRRTLTSGALILFAVSVALDQWQPKFPAGVCAPSAPASDPVDQLRWHLRRQA